MRRSRDKKTEWQKHKRFTKRFRAIQQSVQKNIERECYAAMVPAGSTWERSSTITCEEILGNCRKILEGSSIPQCEAIVMNQRTFDCISEHNDLYGIGKIVIANDRLVDDGSILFDTPNDEMVKLLRKEEDKRQKIKNMEINYD